MADIWMGHQPGTDVALLNAMARIIIEENLHEDHMTIRMEGAFSADRVRHTIESLPSVAESAGMQTVIVDSVDMELPTTLERHSLGRLVAKVMPPWMRIAVVIPPESIDKMLENTARAGGVQFWVVGSIDEACDKLGLSRR